ncbi:MAG: LytTR family transcriptional regulator DNA-binding domain-containing protein [Clostridiales bacterium]|nr:LytTR family transcriptional regulator DNA-binding domain-containing protein [Clostridiales bacterium]
MKIVIEEVQNNQEEEIIIRCHEVNNDLLELVNNLKKRNAYLIGYKDNEIHRIKKSDVYYIEAVDNRVFIYCNKQVYESKLKLYEFESKFGSDFFRASKSTILNITVISSLRPSVSGRFKASLKNGENVEISRKYVPILKSKLGL